MADDFVDVETVETVVETVEVVRGVSRGETKKRASYPVPKVFPVTRELIKKVKLSSTDRLHVGLNKDGDRFVATIGAPEGHWPSPEARVGWFQRVPARRQNKGYPGTQYFLETTDCTAIVIATLWPRDQIVWDDDARTVFDYLMTTITSQEKSLELIARFREYSEREEQIQEWGIPVPHVLKDVRLPQMHPDEDLRLTLYQDVAAGCALRNEGFAYFMEQGTGKTPPSIAVMCERARDLRRAGETRMFRAVIVCPKNVRANWASEIKRFATVPTKVTILRGAALKRTMALCQACVPDDEEQMLTVVICNYETLVQSWETLGMIDWDLACLDEAHFIKSPNTKRTKYSHRLRDKAAARMILTGTPVTNTPFDLWAQLEFLGEGFSGFQSFKAFKEFYGVFRIDAEEGFKKLISVQNLPFMQERLARLSFIIRKEEALPDLPEKVYDVYEVEMTSDQEEVYRSVRDKLYAEIEDDLNRDNNKQLVVNNILTKLLRLAQITSGFVTWDAVVDPDDGTVVEPKEIEYFETNAKLDGLVELLKDPEKTKDDKTLVWACWVPDLKAISKRLTEEGIDHVMYYGGTNDAQREEAEWRYNNDPDCRVFVGNPTAGGTGLNLLGYQPGEQEKHASNTTHEIYYSQNWSPTARSQSEDRGHRRGTRVHVRITDLVVPDTIDEEIRSRVTDKRANALEITDLRKLLSRCLGASS